jgi:hypothetical protein
MATEEHGGEAAHGPMEQFEIKPLIDLLVLGGNAQADDRPQPHSVHR